MYHNFFIHSSVDGHLGCFHVLAIVNSSAVNNRIHVSLSIWFPPSLCLGVGLLGHMVVWGRTDVEAEILATWHKELTHLKRPWCWERLRAGGEGDDRGWDGWMASLTQWTWVWVNSESWWWTGRPGMLLFMWSQRIGHDWAAELNWTELNWWWLYS